MYKTAMCTGYKMVFEAENVEK